MGKAPLLTRLCEVVRINRAQLAILHRTCWLLERLDARDGSMNLPCCHGDDQVHHHEQDTFEPVRFAVCDEIVDLSGLDEDSDMDPRAGAYQKNRYEKQNDLKSVKIQSLPMLV